MHLKLRLADSMNTYNAALIALRDKGYRIWLEPDEDDEDLGDFWAHKDGRDFVAADPLRLLGLVAMWEARGDDWHPTQDEPDVYEEVLAEAYSEEQDE